MADWTQDEDAAIIASPYDWSAFHRRFPQRSYGAFRIRRAALIEGRKLEPVPVGAPVVGIKALPTVEERLARWQALEEAAAAKAVLSPSQDVVPFVLADERPVGIAFIGDTHIGAQIPYDRLVADLCRIRDTPGLYAVHMGDVLDNYKPSGKAASGMYGMAIPDPEEQLEYAADRLAICRGKWLAILQGNHDAWDYKVAGVNRLPDLARHLDAAYVSEKGCTLDVELNGHRSVVGCKHTFAGTSRITKTNAQRRMYDEWPWFDDGVTLDVVVLAHTHEPEVAHTVRHGRDVWYVRTGTYKVKDSYGESLGYRSAYGVPVLLLWPDGSRRMVVKDFDLAVELLALLRG